MPHVLRVVCLMCSPCPLRGRCARFALAFQATELKRHECTCCFVWLTKILDYSYKRLRDK